MTTRVTIEVPEHANYTVRTVTLADGTPGVGVLTAGERTDIYLHDGLKILEIVEVPNKT